MLSGIIIKGIGGFYYVKSGETVYECRARGIFRLEGITPMVGDRVKISVADEGGSVEEIEPRESMMVRPAVANINQLMVVVSITQPKPNMLLIDNFLVMSEIAGLGTVLCLNKIDLKNADEIKAIYERAGYRVICTSVQEKDGIEELKLVLKDKITAFAGNSGVGKSSILNAMDLDFALETGSVSDKIKRGKHTTRHVELLELKSGGFVLDTPGFSTFELPKIPAQELDGYFIEFKPHLGKCRFQDCRHINEPDCAVLDAVENEGISQQRHESYRFMYTELDKVKEWER